MAAQLLTAAPTAGCGQTGMEAAAGLLTPLENWFAAPRLLSKM